MRGIHLLIPRLLQSLRNALSVVKQYSLFTLLYSIRISDGIMCVKHRQLENKGIIRADDSLLILGHYVRNYNANTNQRPLERLLL